jgi:hypothetical protein
VVRRSSPDRDPCVALKTAFDFVWIQHDRSARVTWHLPGALAVWPTDRHNTEKRQQSTGSLFWILQFG